MLHRGNQGGFVRWWLATIVLGVLFLGGTAYEWYGLIVDHGLTISRNLFGTTYYTLVGLHALHVSGGVTIMLIVLGLALRRQVTTANRPASVWCPGTGTSWTASGWSYLRWSIWWGR